VKRITSPSKPRRSAFANEAEVDKADEASLESIVAHDDNQGAEPGTISADDIRKSIGARRRSDVTGRHDAGMGANETEDGLDETEEMMRRGAEDIPTGRRPDDEDTPVFDRRDRLQDI
jgi:hypothetical protein